MIVAVGLGPAETGTAETGLSRTGTADTDTEGAHGPGPEALRRGAGAAVRALTAAKAGSVALALPAGTAAEAEAVALGALLGRYTFTRYRAAENGTVPDLTLVTTADGAQQAADRAGVLAAAVALTSDLVNTSPSHLYPETFATEARQVAEAAGLDVEVLDEKALAARATAASLGVGQGSIRPAAAGPPRLPASGRHQDGRPRRQGHHVRLRRPVAQAAGRDGVDEVRHGRRRRRARRAAGDRRLRPAVNVVG